ncbi:hypothetical protein BH09ACT12_BH09ACT12_35150 [soil metagenome]
MSERELRDLLQGVVPEPPPIDAGPLAAAGRRARNRRRAVVGAAVAAVIAAVAIVPAVLSGSDDRPETIAPAADPDQVYDAVPCPALLPAPGGAPRKLPDLDRVVGARLCVDAESVLYAGSDPLGSRGPSRSGTPDALVGSTADLRDALRSLPEADPDRCATIDVLTGREALVVLLDDGTTTLVGVPACQDVRVEGRRLDAGSVRQAYLEALDAQRDEQSYGLRVPVDCSTSTTPSPASPGREQVVDAVGCTEDDVDLALTPDGLALLQTAWDDPQQVTTDDNALGENPCTELDELPRELALTTDRGDVVRLYESPCGYLVYDSWRLGETVRIPVTYDEVVSTTPLADQRLDPYAANICPSEPPPDQTADADPTDLSVAVEAVMSAVYCDAFDIPSSPLTPEAFVGDAVTLRAAVESVRPMSPLQCRKLSFGLTGFVTFALADGDETSVAPSCQPVDIGGIRLVARQLPQVFLAALDRQRDDRAYGADAEYYACDLDGRTGPVDPARDALVLADTCISGNKPALTPLTPRALDLLRARWAAAAPIAESELEDCYTAADSAAIGYLTITTERGDVVRLMPSLCGYFVPESPGAALRGTRYAVRVTFDELGNAAEVARVYDAYANGPTG